jgi:hypothetical protein
MSPCFAKKVVYAFLLAILAGHFLIAEIARAAQSAVLDSEGYACMGDDKSRKQTEQAALSDAKRKAAEFAVTYIKSETQVKDMAVEKDLVSAYANGAVKVIREIDKLWYKDAAAGDCYRVKLTAEVVPDEKEMARVATNAADDPSLPLAVRVWTDKKEYRQGDRVRLYLKGNKPFYARVLYRDVKGETLQLLPNPYRQEAYFNGGVIYEIPSGNDRFDLEVSPPFGEENIIVYASTAELGTIEATTDGSVYRVTTKTNDIGERTRGISLVETKNKKAAAEFCEERQSVRTSR